MKVVEDYGRLNVGIAMPPSAVKGRREYISVFKQLIDKLFTMHTYALKHCRTYMYVATNVAI